MDDDFLYEGYDDYDAGYILKNLSKIRDGYVPGTAVPENVSAGPGDTESASRSIRTGLITRGGPPSRMYTASQFGATEARPMTSVAGAGYSSQEQSFNPLKNAQAKLINIPPLFGERADNTQTNTKRISRKVSELVLQAAQALEDTNYNLSLDVAKQAVKLTREFKKSVKSGAKSEVQNTGFLNELKFQANFAYALALERLGRYEEAIDTYNFLIKSKFCSHSDRFKVNIGNIYIHQKKMGPALKMYRMALDQIPATSKRLRVNIMRNIANTLIRMDKLDDAAKTLESIVELKGNDFQSCYNLINCYAKLDDHEQMKIIFRRMVSTRVEYSDFEGVENMFDNNGKDLQGPTLEDDLTRDLRQRKHKINDYIIASARLIWQSTSNSQAGSTPRLVSATSNSSEVSRPGWLDRFDWILEELKLNYKELACDIEIQKSVELLKNLNYKESIALLKSFENSEQMVKTKAANNLAFLHLAEDNIDIAFTYSELAVKHDRYNPKVLVNLGICHFARDEFDEAKNKFLEAIGVNANCLEAIYNLGLTAKRLDNFNEAMQAFNKLNSIVPNNPQVLFQVALLDELGYRFRSAEKYLSILVTKLPTDPSALTFLGQIFAKVSDPEYLEHLQNLGKTYESDLDVSHGGTYNLLNEFSSNQQLENQALHYFSESYRYFPVNLDVISWLGVWYVKTEVYEKALEYFETASRTQPNEPKWRLMVASCYRRMAQYQKALSSYEQINEEFPNNLECLRYLIAISKDLGVSCTEYEISLAKLEGESVTQSRTKPVQTNMTAVAPNTHAILPRSGFVEQKEEQLDEEWDEADLDQLLAD